jgi:Rv2258c-like winged HTH domain
MGSKDSVDFDQSKSDKFAEKMMTILNYGALNFMISIGYRTGLFDVMGRLTLSTPEAIAKKANLNERYVREWLGAMFTGGIVEHDHEKNTYLFFPEHAAWLTREATPSNIAVTTQWASVLGSVEDKIVKCFKDGGGATYENYNRFHEVMADESYQTVIVPLMNQILPLVPRLRERLQEGIEVLDVGCGSGFALAEMALAFPKNLFTGGMNFPAKRLREAGGMQLGIV